MSEPNLTDLWSTSPAYAAQFQAEKDIAETLEILDLADARVFVDNGCGNGAFAVAAARQFDRCEVHACDVLPSAIEACNNKAGDLIERNLRAHVAPADRLPLNDRSADRALSRFVLHHIANPLAMFREMRRVMAWGGLFLLQTPCNAGDARIADILAEMFLLGDPSHRRFYYSPAEITAHFQAAKFMLTRPEVQGFEFPYLTVEQAQYLEQQSVEKELNLRPVSDDVWAIDLTWIRVLARA